MIEWITAYGLAIAVGFGVGWWLSFERTRLSYRGPARKLSHSFPDSLPPELKMDPNVYGTDVGGTPAQRMSNPYRVIDAMIEPGKIEDHPPETKRPARHDPKTPTFQLASWLGQCVRFVETAARGERMEV